MIALQTARNVKKTSMFFTRSRFSRTVDKRNSKLAILTVGILGVGLVFLYSWFSLGSDDDARIHQTVNRFHNALLEKEESALKRSLAPSIVLKTPLENSSLSRDDLIARLAETAKNITFLEAKYGFSWRQQKRAKYFSWVISRASFPDINSDKENVIEHIDLYIYTLDHINGEWVISEIEKW